MLNITQADLISDTECIGQHPEDGSDMHARVHFISVTVRQEIDGRWCSDYYVHKYSERHTSEPSDRLHTLLCRIHDAKVINPEHWYFRERQYDNAVPYWATTAFAERERMGTL